MLRRFATHLLPLVALCAVAIAQTATTEPQRSAQAAAGDKARTAPVVVEASIKTMRIGGKWYCEVTLLNATNGAVDLPRAPRWLTVTPVEADGSPKRADDEGTLISGAARSYRVERMSVVRLFRGEGFVKRLEMDDLLASGGRHRVDVVWELGSDKLDIPSATFVADDRH